MVGIQQIKGNVRVLRLGWISSLLLHYIQVAPMVCSRASKSKALRRLTKPLLSMLWTGYDRREGRCITFGGNTRPHYGAGKGRDTPNFAQKYLPKLAGKFL